jgi:hypothetical protein
MPGPDLYLMTIYMTVLKYLTSYQRVHNNVQNLSGTPNLATSFILPCKCFNVGPHPNSGLNYGIYGSQKSARFAITFIYAMPLKGHKNVDL